MMQQTAIDHRNIGPDRLWNKEYIFLFVVNLILAISFYMVIPVIPGFAIQLGSSLALAGVIAGLFSITALVVRPFSGLLVDRVNKRRLLLLSALLSSFSVLGYCVSPSVPVLIGCRVMHGIAFSISGTVVIAFASLFIPRGRLGEGIGYFGMGQIISSAIGPNIGIEVGQRYGYSLTFGLSGAALLVAALLVIFVHPNTNAYLPSEASAVPSGKKKLRLNDLIAFNILPLALLGGVFSMSNGLVSSFLVLLGNERHIANIGYYFTVNALCLLFVRPLAGKLADKKGLALILLPALALTAIEAIFLAKATVLWVVLIAAACKAFGQGSAQPSIQSACIKRLGLERSGVATSTYYIGADIGQGLGPIIGGAVASNFGYQTMFYCSAAVLGSVFLIYGISKLIAIK